MSVQTLLEIDIEDPLVEELESLLNFFERRFKKVGLMDFLCKKLIALSADESKEIFIRHGNEVLKISHISENAREEFDKSELLNEIMAINANMTSDELRILLTAGKNAMAFFSEIVFEEGLDAINDLSNSCYSDKMAHMFKFFKEHQDHIKIAEPSP